MEMGEASNSLAPLLKEQSQDILSVLSWVLNLFLMYVSRWENFLLNISKSIKNDFWEGMYFYTYKNSLQNYYIYIVFFFLDLRKK